jgi:DNA mismatch repair protein MutL
MGGRIRLLPDGVIDQIAAGEVVERPSSLLKELLENAVDASAGRIEAEVFGPFPFSIRVSDDGVGMTAEEAEAAVRRHTTSKIAAAEDLQNLSTYGFRGEALPSIGSVSRLRILTRPHDRDSGSEVVVEGGKVRSVRESGTPRGTTVEVTNLFGNIPARLKFLKTPRTEMTHLWEVFHGAAIPGGGISFRMSDGKTEVLYEGGESSLDRAKRHVREGVKYLVPLRLSSAFFRITGWAGLPHLSRFGASGIHFFVNGRHFRDKGIFAAVREAYRGILPADRQPVIYLFLECDPHEADVNVHPAKMEVRFRYGKDLFELVRHAIGEALGEIPVVPSAISLSGRAGVRARAPLPPRTAEPQEPNLFDDQPADPPLFRAPEGDSLDREREGGFGSLRPVSQLLGTDHRSARGGRADRLLPVEGFVPREECSRPAVAGAAGRLPTRCGQKGAGRDRSVPFGGRLPLRVFWRKHLQDLGGTCHPGPLRPSEMVEGPGRFPPLPGVRAEGDLRCGPGVVADCVPRLPPGRDAA